MGLENQGVPEAVKDTLRQLQRGGFQVGVVSFASNVATQRDVLSQARALSREVDEPFSFIDIFARSSHSLIGFYTLFYHQKALVQV